MLSVSRTAILIKPECKTRIWRQKYLQTSYFLKILKFVFFPFPFPFNVKNIKGTVARDFEGNFFIPIDRPDLGDGPLRCINFGKCACAEKQVFYVLSHMLNLGTNAQFRYEIALAVDVMKKSAKVSFYYSDCI